MSNIFPGFTVNNVPDNVLGNPTPSGNLTLWKRSNHRDNRPNCIFGNFWVAERPSFGLHVCNVIRLGAHKQVIWVDARRVVAFVKDAQPVWNLSEMKHPTQSVGVAESPTKKKSGEDGPVACFKAGAFPKPASVCFFHVLKKAISYVWIKSFINKELWGNVVLHNKLFLFAALQGVSAPLRQFFYPISDPIAN